MSERLGKGDERTGLSFLPSLKPAHAVLLLALLAEALFLFRLDQPHKMVFDETHYVPAARLLFSGEAYTNVEHPLFAKWLIGLSMALFGDDPFGWRVLSTIAGTATVVAMFLIAQALFRDARLSLAAGLITLLDQLVFIQARIAMLDAYMGAFLLVGLWLLIDGYDRSGAGVRVRLIGTGLLFGLSLGCKWAVAPCIGAAGLGYLTLRLRGKGWAGVSAAEGAVWLGGIAMLAYLATFIPAFLVEEGRLTPAHLLAQQLELYRQQTLPLGQHPYQSQWWQWPWIGRSIWYFYEPIEGVQRGILLVGNPAIMWGGLIAVAACLAIGVRRRDSRLLLIVACWAVSYLIWAVIPKKIGFYYYYYLPAVFLSLPLAAALSLCSPRLCWLPPAFLAVALALFVYFYPIIAAWPLGSPYAFLDWMWFDSWR